MVRAALALLQALPLIAGADADACNVVLKDAKSWLPPPELTECPHLRITGDALGTQNIARLSPVLGRATALTRLDLSHQNLTDDGTKELARSLRSHPSLLTLHLAHNGIGSVGAIALAMLVDSRGSKLEQLLLNDNKIGPQGMSGLAHTLRRNSTLTHLDVRANRGGPGSAKSFAVGLSGNNKLRQLNLGENAIENLGARALGNALPAIRALELGGLCRSQNCNFPAA